MRSTLTRTARRLDATPSASVVFPTPGSPDTTISLDPSIPRDATISRSHTPK